MEPEAEAQAEPDAKLVAQVAAHSTRQRPMPGDLHLDHVAHFVPDLDAAADVLASLGFSLRPEFSQTTRVGEGLPRPAGARVRMAMLAEGYIEIIQPVADTPRALRMRARMAGRAGIHLVSFGTPAAAAEHARLQRHGFAPLPLVRHERQVPAAQGVLGACYHVVHVPHDVMPEGRIEYTEHLTPAALWQDRWLDGLNAQCALALVLLGARDVAVTAARWASFSGALPEPAASGARLRLSRGQVLIRKASAGPMDTDPVGSASSASSASSAISACGLAIESPERLLDSLRRQGCAPLVVAPDLWSVILPGALGGCWLFGRRSALDGMDQPA